MSELKPCPFCGEPADDRYQRLTKCRNDKCLMNDWVEDDTLFHLYEEWNTRPIEDALQARIAELEATVEIHADISNAYEKRISEIVSLSNKANAKFQSRIAELEAAQRWIPVSERLPELRVGRVDLVYTVYGEIHSAMYLGNGWTSLYRDFRSNEVTHWMPLPPEVQE